MKKYLPLLLLLCFFIIPKNTNALSYIAKDKIYYVDSPQSLRDFYYFTYIRDVNSTIKYSMYYSSSQSLYCILQNNTGIGLKLRNNDSFYAYSNTCSSSIPNASLVSCYDTSNNYSETIYSSSCINTTCPFPTGLNLARILSSDFQPVYYSSVLYSCSSSSNIDNANFTYSDIEDSYQSSEPVETEGKTMFDVISTFLIQFIDILPFIIPFILIINLACNMLFNDRG